MFLAEYLRFSLSLKNCRGRHLTLTKQLCYVQVSSQTSLDQIRNRFHQSPGSFLISYLGLPLSSSKLRVKDCHSLLSQIRMKLNSWMHRHLRLDGCLRLIAIVIPGIIGF